MHSGKYTASRTDQYRNEFVKPVESKERGDSVRNAALGKKSMIVRANIYTYIYIYIYIYKQSSFW
jgi:hypothetical protein